ncbi:MAG TPA: hypothetical protein PKO30_07420 [Prolixibacteraceae bacterium]|nr:hypothetical protein [Prolixibacteraceae bacterium]
MMRILKWIFVGIALIYLFLLMANRQIATVLFGGDGYKKHQLIPGNIEIPTKRTFAWKDHSAYADSILSLWANKPIRDEDINRKGTVQNIILARMMLKKDIQEMNQTLLKFKVWGISGSTWALNKKGDYDFTITNLTTILWLFGEKNDILFPETRDYLINTLLSEEGGQFRYAVPYSLGIWKDTENHILMTEGSRYLKNRWLALHGNANEKYDNIRNGLEEKLLAFMDEMRVNGLYEFNSLPYMGYTLVALLNMEAFGSEKLSAKAREVLDYANWCYALGSYQLKHYPPMRRRYEKAYIQKLLTDYHSAFMKSWLSFSPVEKFDTDFYKAEAHALMGVCIPYQPADEVIKTIFDKGNGYFVQLGHGKNSCPEIYSAGKHFLLSAGGANQGENSIIVARPICLFLNDTASVLSHVFHLAGPGNDFKKWNNTGVYRNFACAAGPVKIPAGLKPIQAKNSWSVYLMSDSVSVAVFSSEKLGIMVISENQNPENFLNTIIGLNSDSRKLDHQFTMPDETKLEYDVNSPKDSWVIQAINGQPVNRVFDRWALIEGDFYRKNSIPDYRVKNNNSVLRQGGARTLKTSDIINY